MLHLVNRDFIKSQKWNKQILNIHRPHLLAIGKSIVDMMYLFRVNHVEDTSMRTINIKGLARLSVEKCITFDLTPLAPTINNS